MPTGAFEGRHVVVTGGTGALGAAVVEAFAAAGAVCHLPVREDPGIAAGRRSLHVVSGIDLTDEAGVRKFYGGLPELWASVHVAGGFAAAPLVDTTLAALHGQLAINLTTAFLCCREAVRRMRGQGGRIVNVSARAGSIPSGGMAAYAVSKAAVSMLTRAVAEEARADGILVNAVLPGTIDTPANRAAMPASSPDSWSKPADIAATILWLASPENRLTTGALLPV